MSDEKIENFKIEELPTPTMRQLIIETDGNNIHIAKSEMAGVLETIAVLNTLLTHFQKNK